MWEGAKGTVMLYKLWTFSVFSLGSRNGFRDSQEPISGMYMRTFHHDIDQVGIYRDISNRDAKRISGCELVHWDGYILLR